MSTGCREHDGAEGAFLDCFLPFLPANSRLQPRWPRAILSADQPFRKGPVALTTSTTTSSFASPSPSRRLALHFLDALQLPSTLPPPRSVHYGPLEIRSDR
jgi:hypothetical protein